MCGLVQMFGGILGESEDTKHNGETHKHQQQEQSWLSKEQAAWENAKPEQSVKPEPQSQEEPAEEIAPAAAVFSEDEGGEESDSEKVRPCLIHKL